MTLTPIDLYGCALRLSEGGNVSAEQRRMSADVDGWTLAAFHVETEEDVHGDHWELHPAADEAVCVLAGTARFILRANQGGAEEAVTLTSGTAVIVPRGRWHRLELDGPADLMSITLRRGSQLEKRA